MPRSRFVHPLLTRMVEEKKTVSPEDARYLLNRFNLGKVEEIDYRKLTEILERSSPDKLKMLIDLHRKGKINKSQMHLLAIGILEWKNERIAKPKPVKNKKELMGVPKGVFGLSLFDFKKRNKLSYSEVVPLVRERLKTIENLALKVPRQFEEISSILLKLESDKERNRKEWGKIRKAFWELVVAHT